MPPHAYTGDIRAAVSIPFISMVETVGEAIARDHAAARRIGLLAVDGTLAAGLYQPVLPEPVLLAPEDQARFMVLIYRIKGGDTGPQVRREMAAFAALLVGQGAELIIAACTEVPLVLGPEDLAIPLLNSTDLLVAEVVKRATN